MPAALTWFVRGAAYAMTCAPGPDVCRGLALGGGMRDALDLCWFFALDTFVCVGVSFVAAMSALLARRPLVAGLTMLLLPLATLGLPALAMSTVTTADCMPNEAAVGECLLWGAKLGMTAHNAIKAEYAIFDLTPYVVSLASMIFVVGFLFFRPHKMTVHQAATRYARARDQE